MKTLADLMAYADNALLAGDYEKALHGYAVLLTSQPQNLDARLRLADCLLALGEVQRAAVVYTALAKHCAHGGHPLRGLVAVKVLATLEPLLATLLTSYAALYSSDSERLGRGVRRSAGDLEIDLPEGWTLKAPPPREQLIAHCEVLGGDLEKIGAAYPDKLPPLPIFSDLPRDDFAAVLNAMKLRRTRPGEVIVAEGEPGTSFFLLVRGCVAVRKHLAQGGESRLATLYEGAIFGEMALVSASPRTATVAAETDCDLLEFDRDALRVASEQVAKLAAALDKFTRERLLKNLLATAKLFSPLDRKQRLDLVRRFTAHDVASGVTMLHEGSPGRGLFLLLSGQAEVSKRGEDGRVLLATLHPGDVFGEISLVNDEPASASVTAAKQSTVLFLAKEIFHRLEEAVPEIGAYVRNLGEERLMDTRLTLDAADDEEPLTDDDLIMI